MTIEIWVGLGILTVAVVMSITAGPHVAVVDPGVVVALTLTAFVASALIQPILSPILGSRGSRPI